MDYPTRYIKSLLEEARVELRGKSALKVVGRELAIDIEIALVEGTPQVEYVHKIDSLRGIVDQLREEKFEENGRCIMGSLVQAHPVFQQFLKWTESLSDYDRRRAISLVSKGERYHVDI